MKPIASPKGNRLASPLLAAIFVALLCGASACASEEGTTPTCGTDTNGNGEIESAESCNPFATCVVNGKAAPAAECCQDLQGFDLEACLYGYGVETGEGGGDGN